MSEERKKHINHLKAMLKCYENQTSPTTRCDNCDNCELQYAQGNMGEIKETLTYAIASLEVDEAYQLEYESTTKDNLGVEKDLVSSIVEKISEQVTENREEFIFETIRPYCENVVQMKISKRDLEQALLKYYGKNDLGVDCVSRQEVDKLACRFLKEPTDNHVAFYEHFLDLPSVTPQEPKTGHWIEEFVDTEGEVRFTCSCCGKYQLFGTDFCYNCGAKMEEVEE